MWPEAKAMPEPSAVEEQGLAWVAAAVQWGRRKSRRRPEPLGAARRGREVAVKSLPRC